MCLIFGESEKKNSSAVWSAGIKNGIRVFDLFAMRSSTTPTLTSATGGNAKRTVPTRTRRISDRWPSDRRADRPDRLTWWVGSGRAAATSATSYARMVFGR